MLHICTLPLLGKIHKGTSHNITLMQATVVRAGRDIFYEPSPI